MHDLYDTYLAWFTLREIPALGNASIKKLINQYITPGHIFSASARQLTKTVNISSKAVANIGQYKRYQTAARKELDIVLSKGFKIVVLSDDEYPPLLRRISDPPPILTYMGSLDNSCPCVSVVGSRNATSYGLSTARYLSARLAQKGFQIVSGLARGIDSMAHLGALDKQGRTIAVLGSGLSRIYPKENVGLAEAIKESGTVFSEFKAFDAPVKERFPIRNRIIAGLSCGTVVVEAAKKSGSLITARLSGEYNREVFAVPGSIKSKKSAGTHALLKSGACLVESEMDIVDELYQFVHQTDTPGSDGFENETESCIPLERCSENDYSLLRLIEPYPIHIDVLVEKSKLNCSSVAAQLLNLELKGIVRRHPGNFYSTVEETID